MIDGRSARSGPPAATGWAELIPLSAIKQIEIVRGPASALYGADAFLGVVNIITRRRTTFLHRRHGHTWA